MAKSKLTAKQQRFVDEYLIDMNGTQAAIRAGYSKRTANEQAARMLAKASICEVITEGQRAISERTDISQDRVLNELGVTAFAGDLDPTEIKWADKLRALELIGKHLGMFVERVELSGEISIADRLDRARERVIEGKVIDQTGDSESIH